MKKFVCGLLVLASTISPLYADIFSNTVPADLVEPEGLYQLSNPDVVLMSVKTLAGDGSACKSSNDYAGCTLQDVLKDLDPNDDFKPEINVLLSTNDLIPDANTSNAKLRLRGHSSRLSPQKSFRIKLKSKTNLWRGERRIQLIKSVYDFTRVRNALSYELLTSIPALPSLRSQFVNLYIDDNGVSKDYGMFTHVEHVGKEFMVNRGWDKGSAIYKAENFMYKTSSAFALNAEGKPVDKKAFEQILEIKSGKNHKKLNEMLAALNDPSLDFNTQIMGKYFNLENYLSWLSFNILINNTDTVEQNFYLYNPKGKDVFYLMSWDNDYAWGVNLDDPKSTIEQQPRWWYSAANWWDVKLHRRFLEQEGNLALLKKAVTEMRNKYLTTNKIKAITDKYYPVVFPIVTRSPDLDDLYVEGETTAIKKANYTKIFNRLKDNVEQNYRLFMERADDPMTFYIDENIRLVNNKIKFSWDKAVSLLHHPISYDLEIASKPTFKGQEVVQRITSLHDNKFTLNWSHPKGTYYVRVIARDAKNPQSHWQIGMNYFDDIVHPATGEPIRGVVKFVAQVDGSSTINTPPVAQNSTASIQYNTSTLIPLNVTDANGDTLSISITEAPTHGVLRYQGGTNLRYTPNANYTGNDSFKYRASDGKSSSNIATVSMTVLGKTNSIPVAVNMGVSTSKGHAITIIARGHDADTNDKLSYILSSPPSHGTVKVNAEVFTYTPNASFVGVDHFQYVVNDGKVNSKPANVTVRVNKSKLDPTPSTKKGGGAIGWMYLLILSSLIVVRRCYFCK